MRKAESAIVGSLLAVAVPVMMVAGGSVSLAITLLFLGIERPTGWVVGLVLCVCLLAGVALDVRYLKRWVGGIYTVNPTLAAWLFVVLSFPALALGMGVPVGNLALGTLAGLYVGRRHVHAGNRPELPSQAARRAARLTGGAVAALSFPIGMLAIHAGEEGIARQMVEIVGLQYSRLRGIGLIFVLCGVLYGVQYWLTRAAAALGCPGDGRATQREGT